MSLIFLLITMVSPLLSQNDVIINDYTLTSRDKEDIQQLYSVRVIPGQYWYDPYTGMFGNVGGPALGVMYPGHQFGTLSSTASNGKSGVFINGRQLQVAEALSLAHLLGYNRYLPGRYWMAANGSFGIEGYAVALGNIYAALAAQLQRTSRGGDNFWTNGLYSGGNYYTGADGRPSQGYVSVPGYGPYKSWHVERCPVLGPLSADCPVQFPQE